MGSSSGLAGFGSHALSAFDAALVEHRPDAILVQGDTSTSVAAALAAFYLQIPIGHVEAGLRTGQRLSPFPEEAHRLIITTLSTWHFAATPRAAANLRVEGVPPDRVFVTGNTVIDALLWATSGGKEWVVPEWLPPDKRLVLVTAHRRESFGAPLEGICQAVRDLADRVDDVFVVVPVHMVGLGPVRWQTRRSGRSADLSEDVVDPALHHRRTATATGRIRHDPVSAQRGPGAPGRLGPPTPSANEQELEGSERAS